MLVLSAFGAMVGYWSAKFFPSGYQQTQLFFITSQKIQNEDSNLEKYFKQENSRNFADTAVAILESGDFQGEVLGPSQSLTVRKIAPQLIRLTLVRPSREFANEPIQKVAQHFNQKVQGLSQSTASAALEPIGTATQPVFSALNKYVLSAGGFLIGALFAILILGLKVYFRL